MSRIVNVVGLETITASHTAVSRLQGPTGERLRTRHGVLRTSYRYGTMDAAVLTLLVVTRTQAADQSSEEQPSPPFDPMTTAAMGY